MSQHDLDSLDSLESFYAAHARRVMDWVLRLGGPHLNHEDVAQDVFETAVRRLHTFRPERGSLQGWLYGVTRNVVSNARRRARLRRFFGLHQIPEPIAPDPDATELAHRRWRRHQVQLALDSLSDKHREALVLVDLEERTAVDAAALIGVSVGTIYSRLHHARKRFRAALEERLPEAELAGLLEVG